VTPDVASDPFHDTVNVRVVTDVGAVALAVGTVLSTRRSVTGVAAAWFPATSYATVRKS